MSESRRPHSSLAASSASHSLVESIGLRPCQRRIWLAGFLNGSTCQDTRRPRRRSSGGQDRVVLRPVEQVVEVLDGAVDAVDEGGVASLTHIGRSSCRERVCQYVTVSVGAGSLQKKKTKNH